MIKGRDRGKGKAKAGVKTNGTVKVWHIFHFEQRYELPDDTRTYRQTPLVFTRDHVGSGQNDESICYHQQMMALRSGPDHLQVKGAFHELKNIAANRSRCYRGYLLDERLQPATTSRIASWIGISDKDTVRILNRLNSVGLIERVPLPVFDVSVNTVPEEKDERKSPSRDKEGKEREGLADNAQSKKTHHSVPFRAGSEQPGTARDSTEPFKYKGKDKSKYKGKDKGKYKDKSAFGQQPKNNSKRKITASAAPQPKDKSRGQVKRKGKSQQQAEPNRDVPFRNSTEQHETFRASTETLDRGMPEREGQAATETPSSPTTTPPIMPTEPMQADAGRDTDNAKHGVSASACSDIKLGDHLDKLYQSSAEDFTAEVYQAIGCPHPPDSREGRRELGAIAAAWQRAQQAGIKPSELQRLWHKSVKEAAQLRLKRRRIKFSKSAEAVWMSVFNCRLDKLKRGRIAAVV